MFDKKHIFSPKAMFTAGKKLFAKPSPVVWEVDWAPKDDDSVLWVANNTISAGSLMVMGRDSAPQWVDRRPDAFSDPDHIRIEWEKHPGGYVTMHQTCMLTGKHQKIAVPAEISRHELRPGYAYGSGGGGSSGAAVASKPMTATEVMQRQNGHMHRKNYDYQRQRAWDHLNLGKWT